ncbi:Sec-independent protein translocase protein TatB [uncultured Mailhella sp.]|uniref:Sec-independent protein translocase protein TatB n=1 Tax=uncultured Mailhella sp. TaxID=1981031 RepID=UPI003451068E
MSRLRFGGHGCPVGGAAMFGIGSTELLVILIVALLVLGPRNLPKMAQKFGRLMGEFRRVSTEFQRTLNTEIAFEEEKEKAAKAKAAQAARAEEPSSPTAEKPASDQAAPAPEEENKA